MLFLPILPTPLPMGAWSIPWTLWAVSIPHTGTVGPSAVIPRCVFPEGREPCTQGKALWIMALSLLLLAPYRSSAAKCRAEVTQFPILENEEGQGPFTGISSHSPRRSLFL